LVLKRVLGTTQWVTRLINRLTTPPYEETAKIGQLTNPSLSSGLGPELKTDCEACLEAKSQGSRIANTGAVQESEEYEDDSRRGTPHSARDRLLGPIAHGSL
jgi:hypothetical protein